MEYVIVAFRSRTHTVNFYNLLQNGRIKSEIVNTPKEAGVGCGLSVKIGVENLMRVKNLVRITSLNSFAGISSVKILAGKIMVRSI